MNAANVHAVRRMIAEAGQLQHLARDQSDMIDRFPVRPRVDNPVIEATAPVLTPAQIHQMRFAMWKRCKTVRSTAIGAAMAASKHAEQCARMARRASGRAAHRWQQRAGGKELTKAELRELMRSTQRSAKLMSAETRSITAALGAPSTPSRRSVPTLNHDGFAKLLDDSSSSVKIGDARWKEGEDPSKPRRRRGEASTYSHRAGSTAEMRNFRAATRGVARPEVRDRYARIDDPRRCVDCMPGGLGTGTFSTVTGQRNVNKIYGART